jgi:hypothetical protein
MYEYDFDALGVEIGRDVLGVGKLFGVELEVVDAL